jgi:HSP20 family protein
MLPVLRRNGLTTRPATWPVHRLSTLLDRFFEDDFFAPFFSAPEWMPTHWPQSVWEDEQNVYLELDAPGMTEKDIELTVQDGYLRIRAERKCERPGIGYDTRSYGRFEQRIALPAAVDAEKVSAKLSHGVLSVVLPKKEEARARKVEIKVE